MVPGKHVEDSGHSKTWFWLQGKIIEITETKRVQNLI